MATLPPGWAADYDGRRWFFQYAATGHVQYHFPTAGDEFPDFAGFFGGSGSGGAGSAGPATAELLPEERLESERQVRRRATLENNGGGGGGGGGGGQRCSPSFAAAAAVGDDGDGEGDDDDDGGGMCRFENFGYLGPGCHGGAGGVSPAAAAKGSVRGNAAWSGGSLASAGGMSSLTPPPSAGVVGVLLPHQLVDEARNVAPAEKEEEDEGEGEQGRHTYLPQPPPPPPPLPAKVRLVTPTETDRSTLSRAALGGDNDDQRGPSPPPLEIQMLDGRAIPATSPVGRVAELPSAPAAHRAEEEASPPAVVELPGSGASWLEPVPVPVPDLVDRQQHPVELPARAGEGGGGGGPVTLRIPRVGGGAKDDEEEDRDAEERRLHQEILGFFPARKNEEIPRALQIGVPKPPTSEKAEVRRKSASSSEGRRLGPVPSILRPGPRRPSQQQPPTVVAARAGVVAGTRTRSPSSSPPRHHSEVTYQAFRPARPPMVGAGAGGGGGRTQSSPNVDRPYTTSERASQPHHHHHRQEPAQAMGRPHAQSVGAKHYGPLPRHPGVAFMPDPSNHVSRAPIL